MAVGRGPEDSGGRAGGFRVQTHIRAHPRGHFSFCGRDTSSPLSRPSGTNVQTAFKFVSHVWPLEFPWGPLA